MSKNGDIGIFELIGEMGMVIVAAAALKICFHCKGKFVPGKYKYVPDIPLLKFFTVDTNIKAGDRLCPNCYEKYIAPYESRYKSIKDVYHTIRVFPVGFNGETHTSPENWKFLFTEYLSSKAKAIEQLKLMAAYQYCDVVLDLDYDSMELENRTAWSARGQGAYFKHEWNGIDPNLS